MLAMKKVTVSEFRAKCNSIISRVQKTKMPVQITRFGKQKLSRFPQPAERIGSNP